MANIKSLEKDQIEEIAKDVYEKFEKDTGKVPEWVKVMAHSPKILKEFIELFKAVMAQGELEPLLRWKIAYTVSNSLKCPFCVDVTEKMLKNLGVEKDVVEDIKKGTSSSEQERIVLELVKDVTDDANLENPENLKKLKEKFSEQELVEIVSIIGLFNYINRFNNTFAILPE